MEPFQLVLCLLNSTCLFCSRYGLVTSLFIYLFLKKLKKSYTVNYLFCFPSKKEFFSLLSLPFFIFSLRMRRKNWKNPAAVYVDSQVFEDHIQVYASFEVFLEILEGV